MTRRTGRKVILHELRDGLHSTFRFLDPKTRDFLAPGGTSREVARAVAETNNLRVEWSEREEL